MGRRLLCVFLMLSIAGNVHAANVTKILEDYVVLEGGTVKHTLTAYDNISNVTVLDFYPLGLNAGSNKKYYAEFLGQNRSYVQFPLGDMKSGEIRNIRYDLVESKGEAMLGADIYIIDGDLHQLYPKRYDTKIEPKKKKQGINFIIMPMVLMVLMLLALHKYQRRYY
ncbi:MAG: hypothetical protein V1921_01035 [Candidatus Altiarchaeota archaeon]